MQIGGPGTKFVRAKIRPDPCKRGLIDDKNDAIKCSKLKWNHGPQARGFTTKFWTDFL